MSAFTTPVTDLPPTQTVWLEHALEYAVVQSWDELMPASDSGLIQIEYQTGDDGSLDFVKIWASTIRGHWNLVCESWIRPLWSHVAGLSFANGYHAVNFAHILRIVTGHEDALSSLPHHHGLTQIYRPSDEERQEAERWTKAAFDHYGAMPMEEHAAA
jgi:hypothetical protein